MIPTSSPEENTVLDAPSDCLNVVPLSVWRGEMNETPVVISCWKLTKEELEEIQRTGRIYVIIMGDTMPPILPVGYNPFKEEKHETPN